MRKWKCCGIEARRPDIILIEKKKRKGIIIDTAVPADVRAEGKRKGERRKVPGLKERDWKIVGTENGRSRAFSDRSPWKWQKRIWWVDWKAADNKQCWSNAKDCIVGNCEDFEKSVGDVKKRSFW